MKITWKRVITPKRWCYQFLIKEFFMINVYIYIYYIKLSQTGLTMLKTTLRLKTILENINIIHSKRQSRNLKQLLTKSRFSDKTEGTITRCGGKNVLHACN